MPVNVPPLLLAITGLVSPLLLLPQLRLSGTLSDLPCTVILPLNDAHDDDNDDDDADDDGEVDDALQLAASVELRADR